MTFRCEALRVTANGAACQVRLPGVCGRDRRTTVWCHSDSGKHGKGGALKAADIFGFHGCSACHAALPKLSREKREHAEQLAMDRTALVLWESGVVGIVGKKVKEPLPGQMVARQKFSQSTATPSKCVARRVS